MIRKLRMKFVAVNMVIVTLLLSIILGMVYFFTQASLESQSIRNMQHIAMNPASAETLIRPDGALRIPYFMVRLDHRGEFMSSAGGSYQIDDETLLRQLVTSTKLSSQRLGELSQYNLRYCQVDTPHSRFLVFADISGEQSTLDGLMNTCLLLGGIGFIGFLIASILLSGWAAGPVDAAMKRQKKFVADASHELKTPLTVIMTDTQLLQQTAQPPEVQARLLNNIQTMSEQMRAMIEEMLQLARTEAGQAKPTFQELDFSKLITDSALPFDSVFFERGMTLETRIDPEIHVTGDPAQLRRLLEILLDNAQKYGDADSPALVTLSRCGRKRCRLTVANQGNPIPQEALGQIFDRFYRGNDARSRDGSFGLGLSIARNIAEQHRAKLWAESSGGTNRCIFEIAAR